MYYREVLQEQAMDSNSVMEPADADFLPGSDDFAAKSINNNEVDEPVP